MKMESSLEEAPKEKVQRVEIWGSWGPFVAPDRVSTHYSSLKFSVEKLEDLSFNVTESGVERVTYFGSIPVFSIVGKKADKRHKLGIKTKQRNIKVWKLS